MSERDEKGQFAPNHRVNPALGPPGNQAMNDRIRAAAYGPRPSAPPPEAQAPGAVPGPSEPPAGSGFGGGPQGAPAPAENPHGHESLNDAIRAAGAAKRSGVSAESDDAMHNKAALLEAKLHAYEGGQR